MRTKCDMNLDMAGMLSQNKDQPNGWTTSIHCSYYAVFQYMKYLLAEKASPQLTYETQNSHTGEDSHKYILEEIGNRIGNSDTKRDLKEAVRELRQQRVLADYRDKVFTQEESLDCKSKAEAIITKLRKLLCA